MVKFLDLYGQYLSIKDEIDVAIARVIAHSAFIGGSEVSGFEKEFADYQQTQVRMIVQWWKRMGL